MPTFPSEHNSFTKRYKFLRREDISSSLRLDLALSVLALGYHGQVTELSKQYSVSRSFIYSLKKFVSTHLQGLFDRVSGEDSCRVQHREKAWARILQLRLIGKCSISAISELLHLEDASMPHSVCFISKFLNNLGAKLGKMVDWQGKVVYASDEIYMTGHEPVLITVDPISSTILRMEGLKVLSKKAWDEHWQALRASEILPSGLVKDEGVAMRAAHAESHADVSVQTDTFHALSHRLGIFSVRLEKVVFKAFDHEWEREAVAKKAVSESVKAQKTTAYHRASQESLKAIAQYEGFQFLYSCLTEQFNVFDHQGQARTQAFAHSEAQCALEMMKQLDIPKLDTEIQAIEKLLDHLFDFLPQAQVIQAELEAQLGQGPAYFWIYAWQNDKKSRKTKNSDKSKALRNKTATALEALKQHYELSPDGFEAFNRQIFRKLDAIIQSSALVETINSLVRPYMNGARNQLSQQQLNLIRFYLNHRVYQRGKRKEFAPIELIREQKLDKDWLEILLGILQED